MKWIGVFFLHVVFFTKPYPNLYAQLPDVNFRYLDYRQGLPDYCEPLKLLEDPIGRLWFATDRGLFMYDGYEVTGFQPDMQDSTKLPEQAVQALYLHTDGTIWVGTRNMGFCIYDPTTGDFTRILPEEEGGVFPSRKVWNFYRDKDNTIWISCEDGLVKCDPVGMQFKIFQFHPDPGSHLDFEYVNTLREVEDDKSEPGTLWICTRAGLLSFDKSSERFRHYPMPFRTSEVGLKDLDYMLLSMEWTSDNDLWLGTWAGGIMHFSKATQQWKRYRNSTHKPIMDIVYRLVRKSASELWYTSTRQAGIFDLVQLTFHTLPSVNQRRGGLAESTFYGPLMIAHDGTLIIAGNTGLSISDVPVVSNSFKKTQPFITSIDYNHHAYQDSIHPTFVKNIFVGAEENTLSFTLAFPVYQDPSAVNFRFRLEGYDRQWNYNGTSRKIQYTNLPPGSYHLVYEASLDEREWIAGRTSPEIVVKAPFYKTGWFVGLVVIFVIGLLGMIYIMRIRQIQRESKLKTEFNRRLADNEMTALRAQMNPHFMFNSLNSIKNYILKENTAQASKYLTKFSQLMRAILKNSRHKLISLEDELYSLNLYVEMEAMRFNSEFDYAIKTDPDLDTSAVFIPPLLIQPYVENAIWHGLMLKDGPRFLLLKIEKEHEYLQIIIEDNGVGRKRSMQMKAPENGQQKSYGMQITKDRIELINRTLGINAKVDLEDLADDSGGPAGTRVTILMPVIRQDIFSLHES